MGRRIVLGFTVAAVLVVLVIGVAPGLLSGVVAGRLAGSFGTEVRLGWIAWNPFSGRWTVRSVRVAADRGPAAFSARRVAVRFRLWDAIRGRHQVAATEIDGARVRLRATEDGWALPLPARPATLAGAPSPAVQLDAIEAPGAVIRLERASGRRSRLHLRRLNVSASLGDAVRLTAWTRGRLDRAPISAVGRIETAGTAQRVRVRLSASKVDVARTLELAAPTPARQIAGRAELRAKYEQSGSAGAVRRTVSGALAARDLAVASRGVEGIRVRDARLARFTVDLGQQHVALGALRLGDPQVWVRRTGSEVRVAGLLGEQVVGDETPGWQLTVAGIDVAGGTIHAVDGATGEETLTLAVDEAHVGPVAAPDAPVPVSATATVASGGRIVLRGEVVRAPASARGRVELTAVKLPPLATVVPVPVQLEAGEASGAFDMAVAGGVLEGSGSVRVTDLKTISPDPAHPEDVMAFKEARLFLRRLRTAPLAATLDALEIDWPYVLVDRSPSGIFPLTLAGSTDGSTGDGALALRIGRLHVLGGRIDFRDTTLEPPYWRALAELDLEARRVEGPALRIGTFRAKGMVDEISPLRVEGTVGDRTHLHADVERLDLLPFNAYLHGASPYTVSSGAVSGRSDITLDRSQLEVNNQIVLSRFGLSGTEDEDFVKREVGIPLTLALALMKDYRGNIALALPFGGDLKEPTFQMRSVILQAVVRAIQGAVLSPLNALGRVFLQDGRIEEIAVDAVPFPPGGRELDEAGRQRLQQVARVLESHPDLVVRVRGLAAAADVERMQDEAALAALVDAPAKDPVRAFLQARLAGRTPGLLDAQQQVRLDALRAGLPWPGAELHDLARDRGTVAMAALVVQHKIDPERVAAELPDVPAPDQLAPVAGASVELHGR